MRSLRRPKNSHQSGKSNGRRTPVLALIGASLAVLTATFAVSGQAAANAMPADTSNKTTKTSFANLATVLPLGGQGGGMGSGTVAVAATAGPVVIHGIDGMQYPYANAPWPNDSVDPWGMYKRQCVSYTAWKVSASGRHMPYWGGKGSAKLWDDNARAAGIPVDGTPRPGDVAIRNSGSYGHAMYVESVNGDGTINISQYNGHYRGGYSAATVSAAGLAFIHF